LKFEIVASHPQIILPRHSTHTQVLLFDLGAIVARNHVAAVHQKSTRQDVSVKLAMESEILLTVTSANCQITELEQEHYSQRVIDRTPLYKSSTFEFILTLEFRNQFICECEEGRLGCHSRTVGTARADSSECSFSASII
jgi:hypothetical protein